MIYIQFVALEINLRKKYWMLSELRHLLLVQWFEVRLFF